MKTDPACQTASSRSVENGCHTRWRLPKPAWLAVIAALVSTYSAAAGEEVARIEEDWKIVLGTPDPNVVAPQITIVVSPGGSIKGEHAVIEVNNATLPKYSAGGIQLQRWNGSQAIAWGSSPNTSKLSTTGEIITFTVRIEMKDGKLTYEIVSGNSSTWGVFGGQGYLKSLADTALKNLKDYDSQLSLNESRVGYASHCVQQLVRTEVRQLSESGGLIGVDPVDQVIHDLTGILSKSLPKLDDDD